MILKKPFFLVFFVKNCIIYEKHEPKWKFDEIINLLFTENGIGQETPVFRAETKFLKVLCKNGNSIKWKFGWDFFTFSPKMEFHFIANGL